MKKLLEMCGVKYRLVEYLHCIKSETYGCYEIEVHLRKRGKPTEVS